MINIFQLFKIILGLIIAGFFLFFMLGFAGNYKTIQEEQQIISELKNLKNNIHAVYTSGTTAVLNIKSFTEYEPPYISRNKNIKIHDSVPFFFKPGKKMAVYKNTLDLGFWKMDWVGILPELKIVYNPLSYTAETYYLMNNITSSFPQPTKPEIEFSFCSAENQSEPLNRDNFLIDYIRPAIRTHSWYDLDFVQCNKDFPDSIKIIISDTGFHPDSGFLIKPEGAGIGYVYYKQYNKFTGEFLNATLVYKDSLDIVSILIGGIEGYEYKNKIYFQKLKFFVKKEIERSRVLALEYLRPEYSKPTCSNFYLELKPNLETLEAVIEGVENNYSNLELMKSFKNLLSEINGRYGELKQRGC